MPDAPRSQPPPRPATIVIADDHDLARAGLRGMLELERDLRVIGEARTGREAVALSRRLAPTLVLMDVRMPDMDGLEATRAIKVECPATSVLVVTMQENPDYVLEAVKAGAAGYLLKGASRAEIVSTVRQVLRGESPLPPALASQLVRRLAGLPGAEPSPRVQPLSPREREVLYLIVEGRTNPEIAGALGISVGTVRTHVEHLLDKLGVSDRTQAAVRAVELGLHKAPT